MLRLRIRIGYGLDDTVHMGPIRDEKKKDNVLNYIEKGIEAGATLTLDGRQFELVNDLLVRLITEAVLGTDELVE